jgi:hypothetical protein
MNTTLDPDFLRTLVLVCGFRGDHLASVQAALLIIGLQKPTFCAGEIPADILASHLTDAGCATGSLITMGLIECTGNRVKSPNKAAKGRRMNELRITPGKAAIARQWLSKRGFLDDVTELTVPLALEA